MRERLNPEVDAQLDQRVVFYPRAMGIIQDKLKHRDNPLLEPWIEDIQKRISSVDRALMDFKGKTELELKLLLQEKLMLTGMIDFKGMEEDLATMKAALEKTQNQIEERKKKRGEV